MTKTLIGLLVLGLGLSLGLGGWVAGTSGVGRSCDTGGGLISGFGGLSGGSGLGGGGGGGQLLTMDASTETQKNQHTKPEDMIHPAEQPDPIAAAAKAKPEHFVHFTTEDWQKILSSKEFHILRESGTEYPGTGRYLNSEEKGAYHCAGCGLKLYGSEHKFHSGCGWPSFNQEVEQGALTYYRDESHGMVRVEMRCARCDGHMGHVFEDAPDQPTGKRHCVNGYAVLFVPEGKDATEALVEHRRDQTAAKS